MKAKQTVLIAAGVIAAAAFFALPNSPGAQREFRYSTRGSEEKSLPSAATLTAPDPAEAAPRLALDMGSSRIYGTVLDAADGSEAKKGICLFSKEGVKSVRPGISCQNACYDVDAGVYVSVAPKPGDNTKSVITLYNPLDWSVLSQKDAPRCALAHDMTYNPVDGKIYGCFLTEDTRSLRFATLDYNTGQVTTIRDNIKKYVAIAASPEGRIYAIDTDGNYLSVDRKTGAETVIRNTGFVPLYEQSMAFDLSNGRLFWFAVNDKKSALYEIDPSGGGLYQVADWTADHYEVVGATYISDPYSPESPAAPSGLAAQYGLESIRGTVSFTMPTKTFGGATLSGSVGYLLEADGATLREGTAQAGESVTLSDVELQHGLHRLTVRARNDAGSGPKAIMNLVVGYDVLDAPANVRITKKADGNVTVSWDPVTTGFNGGAVGQVKYNVKRMPGSVTVATGIDATTLDDQVADLAYASYSYEVTAVNPYGEAGDKGVSAGMILGDAVAIPYTANFANKNVNATYTVFNANATPDGTDPTWLPRPSYRYWYYRGSVTNDADDWLFTPMFRLEGGKYYQVEFKAQSTPSHNTERLEVFYGNDTTVAAMTTRLTDTLSYSNNESRTTTAYLYAPVSGRYSIGFHCVSLKNQYTLLLHTLKVSAGMDRDVPDTADVSVTPAPLGALSATLRVVPPAKTMGGDPLAEITSCKVVNSTTGKTICEKAYDGTAATFSVTDSLPRNGFNDYVVTFGNSHGQGRPLTIRRYVGLDTPVPVANLKFEQVGLDAVLSWDKVPSVGRNGGYVDPDSVTYRVVLQRPDVQVVATKVRGTTYTDTQWRDKLAHGQQNLSYAVFAQNATGMGEGTLSPFCLFGTPYTLPFRESFAGKQITTGPWVYTDRAGNSTSEYSIARTDSRNKVLSQDDDGGFILYRPYYGGTIMLYSPMVDLSGTEEPFLRFYAWMPEHKLSVWASTDAGVTWAKVADIAPTNTDDTWEMRSVNLVEYAGKKVSIGFQIEATVGVYAESGFDNITITEGNSTDLRMEKAAALDPATAGSDCRIATTVANTGYSTLRGYDIRILHDGATLATRHIDRTLLPDGDATDTIVLNVPPQAAGRFAVTVTADAEGDAATADNSLGIDLDVVTPLYPAPMGLSGVRQGDGSIRLDWAAPSLAGRVDIDEDFEQMTPWQLGGVGARAAGILGRYRIYDGDRDQTNYLFYYPSPVKGMPMAGCVFSETTPDDLSGTVYRPHSGTQCFSFWSAMNTRSDDWLILPELSADKKVSFRAKAIARNQDEHFRVMYSTGGTDIADFRAFTDTVTVNGGDATDAHRGYTLYEYRLPDDARYVAINYLGFGLGMLVDNLCYTPLDGLHSRLAVTGYNVWRDGAVIATVPAPGYTDTGMAANEDHTYHVTALFGTAQSPLSNPVSLPGGVGAAIDTGVRILAARAAIDVYGATSPVYVYTAAGILAHTAAAADHVRIPLAPGVYIVRTGAAVRKVNVN